MSCSTLVPNPSRLSFFSALLVGLLVLSLCISPAHAAGIVYVVPGGAGAQTGADWANAKDLQDALTAATSGDQIWVKASTYKPTTGTDRSATFQLKSGVAIYGGFNGTETLLGQRDSTTNVTILSGDLLGNDSGVVDIDNLTRSDNSYHVVTANSVDSTAILNGLTITAGNASNRGSPWNPDVEGGGMRNNQGNPTIVHVIFIHNSAIYGGGMVNNNPSSPLLSHVAFVGNTAFAGGGLINYGGNPVVTQSIFSGNAATVCGAMVNYVSDPRISQSIFSGNIATDPNGGGAMCNVYLSSDPIIRNSILWGNIGGQIVGSAGTPDVQYTLVQGGYISGTNILDGDPLFVDADGTDNITGTLDDNLRLQVGSPAIDAGNNAFIPADAADEDGDGNTAEPAPFDLDGKPRVVRAVVDMGAYEWQIITSAAPPSPVTYGSAYNHTFTSAAPATFSVAAGALPPGLTLTPGGLLSGTLTAAGVYTATVTVNSTLGLATQTFSIVVNKAPLTIKADNKPPGVSDRPGGSAPAVTLKVPGAALVNA